MAGGGISTFLIRQVAGMSTFLIWQVELLRGMLWGEGGADAGPVKVGRALEIGTVDGFQARLDSLTICTCTHAPSCMRTRWDMILCFMGTVGAREGGDRYISGPFEHARRRGLPARGQASSSSS